MPARYHPPAGTKTFQGGGMPDAVAREVDKRDLVLEQAVQAGDAAGIVGMAADERGVIYAGAAGYRALGGEARMSLDTVFWTASMTKAITSVAALQLVEAGEVSLDAP